jgi:hypothetical protein
MVHALGFASYINPDGSSSAGGAYSLFDKQLYTNPSLITPLIDQFTYNFQAPVNSLTWNFMVYESQSTSIPISVYSPFLYIPGSSLSHFDQYRDMTQYVMRNSTNGGDDRELLPMEEDVLCDIGFTLLNNACTNHFPVGTALRENRMH